MPNPWHCLLLLPACVAAVTLDCKHIRIDKKDFDLSALGGPKTIHEQRWLPPSISNTTFTIDLCSPLKKLKGVDSKEQCPSGTRVCGVEERYNPIDGVKEVIEVRPIAGEFSTSHGRAMDPEVTRLKESSNTDLEGLRIELRGGKFPETRSGDLQKAIVELLCDRELTGNEGFEEDEKVVEAASYGRMGRRADGDNDDEEPELPDLDKGKSLRFVSYKSEKDDVGVLRLTWKTKYACESAEKEPAKEPTEGNKTAGWGFFTWFIIVVFLLIAAYIIFGSWLNYSRYGARGWDLIPHGDTLRDLPYLVKEWVGGLADRMKSGGSRGGYSAV
ncbi:type II membrane protein [Friedmanniomyces endolithicus]|uniref:Autophagy-related protein 27 n=1 Tax=Friedmanniomyces endolithicus TaxID=329885 RepID=A0AAN6J3A7_9PEZI|nr:type II membrane protein [Friedmanniomyces endolithicus]KAK0299402.1 type II membrane protein [Friedmanniomyces endolithicus]KAK0310913.1 type II membrane protein [Friedmanniomyces endolithicus]KAK0983426.1 type II membrane protein [Friedmanniomyces endolithicus]